MDFSQRRKSALIAHWQVFKFLNRLSSHHNVIESAQKKHMSDLFLQLRSSQVKLLITNNAFCIVQRATAQSKNRNINPGKYGNNLIGCLPKKS
jgi:hypothetical protein